MKYTYSKIINVNFDGVAGEIIKRHKKQSSIRRLSLLRENEKIYLKSFTVLETEIKMIEEVLQRASEEMNRKKRRLFEIENEIIILMAQINNFRYRNKIATLIILFSFIIFLGTFIWYFKTLVFLSGFLFFGLGVYGFFNFINRYRFKKFIAKKNQERAEFKTDLAKIRKAELFCKNKRNHKLAMIEKQRKELEAVLAKMVQVKSSVEALEEKEKVHHEILERGG